MHRALLGIALAGLLCGSCAKNPLSGLLFACDPDAANPCGGGSRCVPQAGDGYRGVCVPGEATADVPGPEVPEDNGESTGELPWDAPGGVPDGAICEPRKTRCEGSIFLACKEDGSDWTVTPCDAGTTCTPEGCVGSTCKPDTTGCDPQGRRITCRHDGSGYGEPVACEDGTTCVAGTCAAMICTPGSVLCSQDATSILACSDQPPQLPGWVVTPCGLDETCFGGTCVECFSDAHCEDAKTCQSGRCRTAPLDATQAVVPDGMVQVPYQVTLVAHGGTPPYSWTVTAGKLPDGLTLDPAGAITGTPTKTGTFGVEVKVTDDAGGTAMKTSSVVIHPKGLAITTRSPLPEGQDGTSYLFKFEALGGTPPYGWMVVGGALPDGLALLSDGTLSGTPSAHGTFEFSVRVTDTGDPLQAATLPVQLILRIAPLETTGDQVVDLFLTKTVILPMITMVEGTPIPYSTQLQAKGGVKPYAWAESAMPGVLKDAIAKSGIPQGLTLDASGKLSGSVTDSSSLFELKVPFVDYTLTGFFFFAHVQDSQEPPDEDAAIFLIPTVPVDLGNGSSGR